MLRMNEMQAATPPDLDGDGQPDAVFYASGITYYRKPAGCPDVAPHIERVNVPELGGSYYARGLVIDAGEYVACNNFDVAARRDADRMRNLVIDAELDHLIELRMARAALERV